LTRLGKDFLARNLSEWVENLVQVVHGFLFLAIDEESGVSDVVRHQASSPVSRRTKPLAGCAYDGIVYVADDGLI
jgi:hypothetical protein